MKHTMLLDCTLRDGAYLVDKTFGDKVIKGIISGLVDARIDCIEIGFLQDEGYGEGKTVYKDSKDASKYVPLNKGDSIFTVLADCSRYTITNLDDKAGTSIDAIRECFFKEERYQAIENCKIIKAKGYKCFIQPVDILGYTDLELIELIQLINEIEPYCFSIVDTFGSMYKDDLHRVFEIINHNLLKSCKIGFHSHNNMQLSNALSQEFVDMSFGKREIIVDVTISGMGRGAGNTPTELVAQYMVEKWEYSYNMDSLLDIIDDYMDNIRTKCDWGYSTPYFVAGCYGAHVNNVTYLTQKNSIRYKDIRYILNKIGEEPRKRYDYDLLERTYFEHLSSEIDDNMAMHKLKMLLNKKKILVLLPGNTISTQKEDIVNYIEREKPFVICVNFIVEGIEPDMIYVSNFSRYTNLIQKKEYWRYRRIITSNIKAESEDANEIVVSFNSLIKCGWNHLDNSMLMLLRLLDRFYIVNLAIAGFDGYSSGDFKNYVTEDMELSNVRDNPRDLNSEIVSMLKEFKNTRKNQFNIEFITVSRFSEIFE